MKLPLVRVESIKWRRDYPRDHRRLLRTNPVHKSFTPKLPQKEARFLTLEEVRKLLLHVEGKPYEIAVWLGAFMGLRVGEIQALRWEDIDFNRQALHVRRAFARSENVVRDYRGNRLAKVADVLQLFPMPTATN